MYVRKADGKFRAIANKFEYRHNFHNFYANTFPPVCVHGFNFFQFVGIMLKTKIESIGS